MLVSQGNGTLRTLDAFPPIRAKLAPRCFSTAQRELHHLVLHRKLGRSETKPKSSVFILDVRAELQCFSSQRNPLAQSRTLCPRGAPPHWDIILLFHGLLLLL